MTDSIRLQCLRRLKANFEAVKRGEPTDDPYLFGFSVVAIGPLADFDNRKLTAVGIVVGAEQPSDQMPNLSQKILTCNIEWRITRNKGDEDPGILAEIMLTEVQRVMYSDRTLGGLCIDIRETGNEVDLDTYLDRGVVGVLRTEILYRHSWDDPRTVDPRGF